ncbi:hypothetical protein [Porphyromonas sp. KLE 1280]|uniref:hypothetical protein n=1 Tax=Porphyromonas sp. KLE 1280 TaxID=997829 RepID=UPI0012EB57DF|nr:hypothetical protein [Porphyromonas sp. KLE 1280]
MNPNLGLVSRSRWETSPSSPQLLIPSASTATPQAATLQKVWKHWVESSEAVYG